MKLKESDRYSALWQSIEREVKERLEILRQKNDGDLNEIETATIRGSIKTFKEILSWGQPPEDPAIYQ